jgi:hypothetical protein
MLTDTNYENRFWTVRLNHLNKFSSRIMGWAGSRDTASMLKQHLRFERPEEAILYCERIGLAWRMEKPKTEFVAVDNQYKHNFLPKTVEIKMETVGAPHRAKKIWKHEGARKSAWVNLRHSTFGPDKWVDK